MKDKEQTQNDCQIYRDLTTDERFENALNLSILSIIPSFCLKFGLGESSPETLIDLQLLPPGELGLNLINSSSISHI